MRVLARMKFSSCARIVPLQWLRRRRASSLHSGCEAQASPSSTVDLLLPPALSLEPVRVELALEELGREGNPEDVERIDVLAFRANADAAAAENRDVVLSGVSGVMILVLLAGVLTAVPEVGDSPLSRKVL